MIADGSTTGRPDDRTDGRTDGGANVPVVVDFVVADDRRNISPFHVDITRQTNITSDKSCILSNYVLIGESSPRHQDGGGASLAEADFGRFHGTHRTQHTVKQGADWSECRITDNSSRINLRI